MRWLGALAVSALALGACATVRPYASPAPDYDHDVRPILVASCGSCHGTTNPAAGWSASRFTDAVACLASAPDGGVSVDGDAGSTYATRLVRALARPDHQSYLDAPQLAVLQAWLAAGAPASRGAMHDIGFADPRSPNFHARFLRGQHWVQMLDPTRADSCGRCHDGAPTRPPGATGSALNAPACTSCHDQPGGPLACGTCHGAPDHAYPPRDPCFFPEPDPAAGAHAVHMNPTSAFHAAPFTCSTCHPARTTDFSGDHGNGVVELSFDPRLAGPNAHYDPSTNTCTVACHSQGGHRPNPAWSETSPMTCNDCHTAPPANHPLGPCTNCHAEPNATGTALTSGPFHLNGHIDLGDGDGTCNACHGRGNGTDGWPTTGSHPSHRAPLNGAPVACGDCHAVPTSPTDPVHFAGAPNAVIHFGGRALARGATPTINGLTCSGVACHGAGLGGVSPVMPVWGDTSGSARRCGQCHGIPPPTPHVQQTDCESVICHGGEITPSPTGPQITPAGRALHQNGVIDVIGVQP